jgi:hypothetical protein
VLRATSGRALYAREARRAVPIWHGESVLCPKHGPWHAGTPSGSYRPKHGPQNIFASFSFSTRDMKYIYIYLVCTILIKV